MTQLQVRALINGSYNVSYEDIQEQVFELDAPPTVEGVLDLIKMKSALY